MKARALPNARRCGLPRPLATRCSVSPDRWTSRFRRTSARPACA